MIPKPDELKFESMIRKDVDLKPFNTLGVHANASKFIEIVRPDQLSQLHFHGFFEEYSPLILGGGSNMLLLGDPGQPVLKISVPGMEAQENINGEIRVTAGAGEQWHEFVKWAVENDFGGIENLALIPGTVGAAPIQNIGAYGVELKDIFEKLTAFNTETGAFETFYKDDCEFAYRDSIFKHELKGKRIVCDVTLRLTLQPHKIEKSYNALSQYLDQKRISDPGIKDIFNAVVDIRRSKLPDPREIGNAGSFFKNPVIEESTWNRLMNEYPDIPSYQIGENSYKIPAAWFIEKAGLKGKRSGNVGTYKNQALVLVNFGGATGLEIYQHAKKIQALIQKQFGINLDPEVNIIGK